ncbi:hypothetical protein [Actinoplanes sp. NPDC049265]|uniref:hypothetical protein n=1 Tax=Actinoplanes sp. NPDC049265 TaxID=3363902 RepID=UPI0037147723
MTATSLIAAVLVGAAIGLGGRLITPAGRGLPAWVAMAAGVGAAVLGTIVARLSGADGPRVGAAEIVLQVAFAGAAVTAAGLSADRRSTTGDRKGTPR